MSSSSFHFLCEMDTQKGVLTIIQCGARAYLMMLLLCFLVSFEYGRKIHFVYSAGDEGSRFLVTSHEEFVSGCVRFIYLLDLL